MTLNKGKGWITWTNAGTTLTRPAEAGKPAGNGWVGAVATRAEIAVQIAKDKAEIDLRKAMQESVDKIHLRSVIASLVERGHVHLAGYIHVAATGSCYATMRSPDGVLYELRSSNHSTHRLNLAFDVTSADGVEESLRLSAEYERRAAERLVEEKRREEKRQAAWEAMDVEARASIWRVSGIPVGKAGPKYIRRGGFHRERFVRAMDSWMADNGNL